MDSVRSRKKNIFSLFFKGKNKPETEEEFLEIVDATAESGAIDENEHDMIKGIVTWNDNSISSVMTHRKDIAALEKNSKIVDVVRLAIDEGYSRIPIYEERIDKIVGIINVKDLLILIGSENLEYYTITQFLREVQYFPATGKCKDVFNELIRTKSHLAVVCDEYGGTEGIITIEDLIEEVFGNIQDEYDDEDEDIEQTSENTFLIDGDADPKDIFEELNLSQDVEDFDDFETMSAFFTHLLGRVPENGETLSVNYEGIEFVALVVEGNRVDKIKAIVKSSA